MKNNKQKVVLITGASSGMGRATALYLSQKGFMVYATSRTANKLFNIQNKNLKVIDLDLTNNEHIQKQISDIKQIDILINNAGYGLVSTIEEVSEKEMFDQFNVNVFGLLKVTQAVIPKMRKQRSGIIINISSFLGQIGLPLLTCYNASKYAVEGITDSLRYELKPFNIRVHSIMPGFFSTNFAKENLICNKKTFSSTSPYASMVQKLTPIIVKKINNGNNSNEVAELILGIIENQNAPARQTVGEEAKKFIPMKKELSDEDFERRVEAYYNL